MGSRRDLLASLGPAVEHAFVPAGHEARRRSSEA